MLPPSFDGTLCGYSFSLLRVPMIRIFSVVLWLSSPRRHIICLFGDLDLPTIIFLLTGGMITVDWICVWNSVFEEGTHSIG